MRPAISVVVPVHNSERYLRRCLHTLAAQTFTDIEIVIVNDGSTDSSQAICEVFAAERAKAGIAVRMVCHEEARGVSAARNSGVAAACGRYVGFVDADDWAAPTMFETLWELIELTDADIAQINYRICRSQREADTAFAEAACNGAGAVRTITNREAFAEMLREEHYAVWNRLYRRSMFDDLEPPCFPEGLTCEDRVGNARLLASRAKRVVVSERVEYGYFLNLGSISHNGLDVRGLDILEADRMMVEYARTLGDEQLVELACDRAAKGSFSLLIKRARYGVVDPALDQAAVIPQLKRHFRESYKRLMASPLSRGKKLAAWQLRYCPGLLRAEFALLGCVEKLRARRMQEGGEV